MNIVCKPLPTFPWPLAWVYRHLVRNPRIRKEIDMGFAELDIIMDSAMVAFSCRDQALHTILRRRYKVLLQRQYRMLVLLHGPDWKGAHHARGY